MNIATLHALYLKELFRQINREYFDNRLACEIKLGKKRTKERRRCVRLGSYNFTTNVIRINPELLHHHVPLYVLRYIVYHEMLHAFCLQEYTSIRNHQGQFKIREKMFTEFGPARRWLRKNKSLFITGHERNYIRQQTN